MTAEIAIMNKSAVALAADSAVTVAHQDGEKVFNTTNKLFMLSKYHPVGIMIYGNAQFMDVPWETIIKIYRNHLDAQEFDTVEEYAKHFFTCLQREKQFASEEQQEKYFKIVLTDFFISIHEEIKNQVNEITKDGKSASVDEIFDIAKNVLLQEQETRSSQKKIKGFTKTFAKSTISKFKESYDRLVNDWFGLFSFRNKYELIYNTVVEYIGSDTLSRLGTGVVFAGFGKKELFPSVVTYNVEAIINGKLKYIPNEDKSHTINHRERAEIIPFAQDDMAQTFIKGVHPDYDNYLIRFYIDMFRNIPGMILENISGISDEKKKEYEESTKQKILNKIIDGSNNVENKWRQSHINPLYSVVETLPKDQLAVVAETLVNITLFKQKVTPVTETVGGPIDVAIISKGDGFIWIKRKHYFDAAYNPVFFQNYLLKEGVKNGK